MPIKKEDIIYNIDISELAERDLKEIILYISSQLEAPMTAREMLVEFNSAISSLSQLPYRISLVADERLAALNYRMLKVKNYLVFFTIDEEGKCIDIVRILYARRNWQAIL